MVTSNVHIIAIDRETGELPWHCPGPDARGACGRIAIGDEVPCIGRMLVLAGSSEEPYVVAPHMTLCPLTLAFALGVSMGRRTEPEAPVAV